jgi:phosphatidate cytidylyltransferase
VSGVLDALQINSPALSATIRKAELLLKLRVITAVVLLAVLLPLLFHDNPRLFVGAALLMLSAGAWEWGRLNGLSSRVSVGLGMLFGGGMAVMWWQLGLQIPQPLWYFTAGLWLAVVPWLLKCGVDAWVPRPRVVRLGVGVIALGLAWIAMAQARTMGINFLLSLLALVWMADIAAYFGGKAFGRRKLAPSVSPGKSWEGAVTGWLGVLALATAWIWLDTLVPTDSPSLYTLLQTKYPVASWLLFSCLSVVSVLGDLMESLVKRSAGFKDSSNLLPGHGGVLDRVDALLPVLPLAMLFVNF